jgi:hypothetical protein
MIRPIDTMSISVVSMMNGIAAVRSLRKIMPQGIRAPCRRIPTEASTAS